MSTKILPSDLYFLFRVSEGAVLPSTLSVKDKKVADKFVKLGLIALSDKKGKKWVRYYYVTEKGQKMVDDSI